MKRVAIAAITAVAALAWGCGHSDPATSEAPADAGVDANVPAPIVIASSPQRSGDPDAGYQALVNNGYVGCGIPWTAYSAYLQLTGPTPAGDTLPGRNADNAPLPYSINRFTTSDGIDVVGPNCLQCHSAPLNGALVIGLGDTYGDYTTSGMAGMEATEGQLAQSLVTDPSEKAELTKFLDRLNTIGPYTKTITMGVNPADNVAAVIFAHRDAATLAWSDTPILPVPPVVVVPVDVPPWWRMAKKNALFYTAAGLGDHARIMMTASTLCIDSVDDANAIDAYFPDVAAYVASIPPPKFPHAIDMTLAATGQNVFEETCARCHGTYGASATYPNLVISIYDVATDNALAEGAAQFASGYENWFNTSFYGQKAQLDSLEGYYAPPLDGIWATAPYLHNGSVPTMTALLDSTQRPTYWTRKIVAATKTYDPSDYDDANLGWNFTTLTAPQAKAYDTTKLGYGNGGHTYGDALSSAQRTAVIEYLKTL